MSSYIMSHLTQQTEEWHKLRKQKIGASDAPVIMQVSPWKTPLQLWEEKTLGTVSVPNRAQQRGLDLEQKARDEFEKMTGVYLRPRVKLHATIEWMMASLDGCSIDGETVAEIKCAGERDHSMAVNGKVPDHYFPQLQHQLEVCELDCVHYFSFDGEKGVIVKVYRDDAYIKEMLSKEKEFWERMMNQNPPPAIESRDFQAREDLAWRTLAERYALVSSQLGELESMEKELRSKLIETAENKNSIGAGIKLSRVVRKGNVDYSVIPELQSVELDQYRKKPIESWRITMQK
jgi:putative phage-type endonuclease